MEQATTDEHAGESTARLGRWLVVAAALLWSTNGLFVKWPIFADWPEETRGLALALWRATFACLGLVPLVRRPRWNIRLVPMALGFLAMNCTFLPSMTFTTAANAIWLQNTAPIWVYLSGLWIYREPFDRRNRVPLVTGLAGALLIVVCEVIFVETQAAVMGVLLGVASGLCYAIVVVSLRRLSGFDPAWLIVVNQATSAVLLAPYVFSQCPWPHTNEHGNQWWALAAFGVVQLALPYWLFAKGLQRIASQEAAAVGLLEPVLVPIWVWLAWRERPAWWTIAGGALILVGLCYRYLRASPAARR